MTTQASITLHYGRYYLQVDHEKGSESIELHPLAVRTLALSCNEALNTLPEDFGDVDADGPCKTKAQVLLTLPDDAIRLVLREVPYNDMIDMLWYLESDDMVAKILAYTSERAGLVLKEDLALRRALLKNELRIPSFLAPYRAATYRVLNALAQLQAQGVIAVVE